MIVNVDRTVVYNRVAFSKKCFKCFVGYEDNSKKSMPLCIMLPKTSGYRRSLEETKYMYFLIKITNN